MQVALTGASGFIGSTLTRQLADAGHDVVALVRSTSRREHIERYVTRFVEADHADPTAWPHLLDGSDAIIHNSVDWESIRIGDLNTHVRSNIVGSLDLLTASAPRQFVFLSSIAVHHDMRPRWEGVIDEDHPLRPAGPYGAYKAAVEAHLWAAWHTLEQPTCALRPCAVYGVDPRLERSIGWPIIEKLRTEGRYDRAGGGKFVHVEDVAAAAVATLGNEQSYGMAYNLVDCYARWSDWARYIADELGVDAEIDESSPSRSRNTFTKDIVAEHLGVPLDRGHDGIRAVVRELVALAPTPS